MSERDDPVPRESGDSMLALSMESPRSGLAARMLQRIAEKSLSGPDRGRIAGQSSGGRFLEHELFEPPSTHPLDSEWRARGGFSRARLSVLMELDRLGFDPAMLDDSESLQSAVVAAELVLWLSAHSDTQLETDLSLAARMGPSAAGSLSAILARACGEPVPGPSSALSAAEKRLLVGQGPRMPADWHSCWYPAWPVSLAQSMLCAQHPGSCDTSPTDKSCRRRFWEAHFLPAVASDFSHNVFDGSASARARAGVMLASGALAGDA